MDRLAWDLGDPAGAMKGLDGINEGAGIPDMDGGIPDVNSGFVDFHPMKGPMLTQTLQDIIGHEPFHWRGDRLGLEEFNPAFEDLQGDDERLTPAEMQEYKAFLATIHFPPNPFRTLTNELSADLPLPDHHTTGRFAPAGQPLPDGNAFHGRELFTQELLCHTATLPTGMGANAFWNGSSFDPLPRGPNGEGHFSVVPPVFERTQNFKIPSLRNLYERTGFDGTSLSSRAGFGVRHAGTIDSLERFVSRPFIEVTSDQDVADLVAFLLSFSGETERSSATTDPTHPPGSPGQRACRGRQADDLRRLAESAGTALLAARPETEPAAHRADRTRAQRRPRPGFHSSTDASSPTAAPSTSVDRVPAGGSGSPVTIIAFPRGGDAAAGADLDAGGALAAARRRRAPAPRRTGRHLQQRPKSGLLVLLPPAITIGGAT
jgi:hypothetical protein